MPWTYNDPPAVAQNWTDAEQRRCVDAANEVLERGGTDEEAIFACIAAAGKRSRGMLKKTYRGPIEFKADADQTGEFSCEFATLNVIDHDQDVTTPGAFHEGQPTLIEAWNHNYGIVPVGKGIIREKDDKAIFDGRFFLDTQSGLEHYKTVKALGDLTEWSYTFEIEESELGQFEGQDVQFLRSLDVWGVAPVQRGAGIATRTVAIKGKEKEGGSDADSDNAGTDEGEAGDGKPSGPPPQVVSTLVEIDLMEAEL